MCSTRANLVTKELLRKMKKAGCSMICFGVESGNPRILKQSKKNIKLDDVIKAVKLSREIGINSFLSFILGHPDEKIEEMVDTINFAVRANPDVASIGTMVPYPGTEIADIAAKGGGNYKILSKDWTEYSRQFSYVLELKDVSKRDMDKIQLIGTLKLYIYNLRFLDLIKFLYQHKREAVQFFKMVISTKTEKNKKISTSRLTLPQLVGIFFSKVK